MTQKNNTKYARKALLAYMEWWSENKLCAGWLINLADIMSSEKHNSDIKTFKWLVEEAGGWYIYEPDIEHVFILGTFQELLDRRSGEK